MKQADEDGYSTFQFWSFMSAFGYKTSWVCQYFDNNILLDTKDLDTKELKSCARDLTLKGLGI
jgi:hypothetical protein